MRQQGPRWGCCHLHKRSGTKRSEDGLGESRLGRLCRSGSPRPGCECDNRVVHYKEGHTLAARPVRDRQPTRWHPKSSFPARGVEPKRGTRHNGAQEEDPANQGSGTKPHGGRRQAREGQEACCAGGQTKIRGPGKMAPPLPTLSEWITAAGLRVRQPRGSLHERAHVGSQAREGQAAGALAARPVRDRQPRRAPSPI